MSDEVTQQAAELSAQKEDTKTAHVVGQQLLGHVIQERDDWRAEATRLNDAGTGLIIQLNVALADVERLTEERDAAQADLKQAEENNHGLMTELQNMRAGLEVATEERDAALAGLNLQLAAKHVIIKERDTAEEKCRKLHAENEGLRADALAYPPQRIEFTQYCNLKADYDRQVIMIETLQEGLKRTEAMLKAAQGQDIDDRLKGFLAVISQLADQAQDLLP